MAQNLTLQARRAAEEEEQQLAVELPENSDENDGENGSEDESVEAPAAAPMIPLRFNLGSLAEANLTTSSKKKKAAPKNKGKKTDGADAEADDADGVLETGAGSDETSSLELYNEIEARKDTQLRQVIKALDCKPSSVPVCLAGMFPDKVLFDKFKAGHQLKGVPWSLFNSGEMKRLVWCGFVRRQFIYQQSIIYCLCFKPSALSHPIGPISYQLSAISPSNLLHQISMFAFLAAGHNG